MSTTRSRGFTLIELLVVIAIIGILSAVVLASLSTARQKGQNAAIQANLKTIQTQAEIYYGNGNTYGTAGTSCTAAVFSDTTIQNAIASAQNANGGTGLSCHNSTTNYAISSPMVGGGHWCVDSSGFSASTSAAVSSTSCS